MENNYTMKDDKNMVILLVSFLLGFVVGGLTISVATSNNGDTATWFYYFFIYTA